MKRNAFLLVFSIFCLLSYAQFQPASFMINGNTLPYQVLFPENYDKAKQYPLVILLHGAGERGNDNEKQLTHGKNFLTDNFYSKYPAVVIVPQCPANTFWSNVQSHTVAGERTFKFGLTEQATPAMETLIYLIDDWLASGLIDTKQVYVGGLSMGGMGTYELLWRMPNTFAAAFPKCGGGDINKMKNYTKTVPLWIFHGADDSTVPAKLFQDMSSELTRSGNDVRYSEYPGVNHNSWDNAFKEKDLAAWLFSHKK